MKMYGISHVREVAVTFICKNVFKKEPDSFGHIRLVKYPGYIEVVDSKNSHIRVELNRAPMDLQLAEMVWVMYEAGPSYGLHKITREKPE